MAELPFNSQRRSRQEGQRWAAQGLPLEMELHARALHAGGACAVVYLSALAVSSAGALPNPHGEAAARRARPARRRSTSGRPLRHVRQLSSAMGCSSSKHKVRRRPPGQQTAVPSPPPLALACFPTPERAPPLPVQAGLGKASPPAAHPEEWALGKEAPSPATAVVAAIAPGGAATTPVLPPSPFSSEATGTLPPFQQEPEATPAKPAAPPADKLAVDLLVVGVSAAAAAAAAFEAQQECVTEGGERAYGVQLGDNIVPHGRLSSLCWQGISCLRLVCQCTMCIVSIVQPCLQLLPLISHAAAQGYTPCHLCMQARRSGCVRCACWACCSSRLATNSAPSPGH